MENPMTIYQQLLAKAAEWEHDDYHRIPLDDGKHAYACSLDCRKCQLEALAKQVCAEAIKDLNSRTPSRDEHGYVWMKPETVERDIIGGPK